ncbi:MAG: hypothetical protein KKE89_02535 [Actinobacteria bacterium]|nr:hypothetical protein [Actinomycetota bacterium]
MGALRHHPAEYAADRTAAGWELRADGRLISAHRTFSKAVDAAGSHDRDRRRNRAVVQRIVVVALAGVLLIPVLTKREVDNPAYPPARALADRMEAAYRAVDGGMADIESFDAAADGFSGAVFEVSRAGVTADYNVLAGRNESDCYLIRWVRFEVPFVARLLPRYECVPGQPMLNFSPSAYEAIAVNLATNRPLEWQPVLPDPIDLAPWFFPAMILLLVGLLQQMITLSMLYLKPTPPTPVTVQRVEPT